MNREVDAALAGFFAASPQQDGPPAAARQTLGAQIVRSWQCAQATWPGVEVSLIPYARYLGERALADVPEPLGALHTEDLYLACGCAMGAERAIVAVDRQFKSDVAAGLGKMNLTSSQIDEVLQRLRHKLFVAQPESQPRIVRYSGRGPLLAWLRATAVRDAIDLLRAGGKEHPVADAECLDVWMPRVDPELELLKDKYRLDFKAAFRSALASLRAEQRNLLRYQVLDQLTLAEIGAIYGIHLSTVARRLDRARATLLQTTREDLAQRLQLDEPELDSILRLIGSQLEVSLTAAFTEEPRVLRGGGG
jgi:RNA polymerase sigma-70 factor (ECF subfamily)